MSEAENTSEMTTTTDEVRQVEEAQKEANKEAVVTELKAKFDNKIDVKSVDFRFRPIEDKDTGIKNSRPRMTIQLPVPSVEGILDILTNKGGKELELLQEAVSDVIERRAKDILANDDKWTITGQNNFPVNSVLWETIANLPKTDRRSSGIDEETWKEFSADYIAIMPGATGKDVDKVTAATKLYIAKFAPIKGKENYKKIIAMLKDQLMIYAENSPNVEKYAECVNFLIEKADTLIEADDIDYSSNL